MKDSTPTCFQCGSPLIEVSRVTQTFEGSRFPQTITKYRCSNAVCQAEKDKEQEKRLKQQKERELASERRKGKNTAHTAPQDITSLSKKN